MSRAFVKEGDGDLEPLPDLPLSPHPNYVTPRGFAALQSRLQDMLRTNTFDEANGTIVIDDDRLAAIHNVSAHYQSLLGNDPATAELRENYAMKDNTVADAGHRRAMTAFYWWTAWSAVTQRPGKDITYTNNWPHEPLVGNIPPSNLFMWTVFSVLFLIAGIGLLGWHYAVNHGDEMAPVLPKSDPLAKIRITPSMRATAKYFWVVMALFLTQILLGLRLDGVEYGRCVMHAPWAVAFPALPSARFHFVGSGGAWLRTRSADWQRLHPGGGA